MGPVLKWCVELGLDPFKENALKLAIFWCFLHDEKILALYFSEGSRTAFSRVFKAKPGLDLGRYQCLSILLTFLPEIIPQDNPVKDNIMPIWDATGSDTKPFLSLASGRSEIGDVKRLCFF